jgi:tricarballylate dehydrogenase
MRRIMAQVQRTVVIVGAGIAGLSAALAARELDARVVVLERAPEDERGGNTRFSNGAIRAVSDGVNGGRRLTREQYLAEIAKVTDNRADPDLAALLVDDSRDTIDWLAQRYGVVPGTSEWNRGAALSESLFVAAEKHGVELHYGTRAVSLLETESGLEGVIATQGRNRVEFQGDAVVLAAGGFEANPEWRARYIGPGWDLVKVRGTRFNTGDGLRMALEAGAMPYGNWSGCHTTNWDLNAPDQNTLELNTVFKRDSFNYGILVNRNGERFLDEGEDFGGLMYARLGRVIMEQPGQTVWQIYDAQTSPLLLPEYHAEKSSRVIAGSIEEMVSRMDRLDRPALLKTIAGYNAAVCRDVPFDPRTRDGKATTGLAIPKSNWATPIEQPPFEAYPCTNGITFTFGGVRIDLQGRVLDVDGNVIPRLYAAGEMVGGLFYFNYPGGAGLASAAVFGRLAGRSAASDPL